METASELDPRIADTLLAAVDGQQPALVELARALIACRTDSQSEDNPEFSPEARRCQEIVATWLADLGADVQRWDEPPRYPVVAGTLPGSGPGDHWRSTGMSTSSRSATRAPGRTIHGPANPLPGDCGVAARPT